MLHVQCLAQYEHWRNSSNYYYYITRLSLRAADSNLRPKGVIVHVIKAVGNKKYLEGILFSLKPATNSLENQ